jgi:hypothetical protein
LFSIYKATHVPAGKVYVGQTRRKLEVRIGQHWGEYKKLTKFHQFLHTTKMNEWSWETMHVVPTLGEARQSEMYYIKTWNLYEYGLNSKTGLGAPEAVEARKDASERMKAYRAANPEPWHKGRTGVYSEETINLMRMAKLRKPSIHVYTPEELLQRSLNAKNAKSVTELKSGLVFNSISSAAKHFGLRREAVRDAVKRGRLCRNGLVFVYTGTQP